ncbi:MAG: hypothetical protein WAK82_01915 [Streptosporangiaceae bacterium]
MTTSEVIRVWQEGASGRLGGLLAPEATFSSPVADYRGRGDAAHVLGLIASVLEEVECASEWAGAAGLVASFNARVDGAPVQGMVREQRDETGALVQVTLFLRPYGTLSRAIGRMRELLDADPLPSTR